MQPGLGLKRKVSAEESREGSEHHSRAEAPGSAGQLRLLKGSPQASLPESAWEPFVEDHGNRSFSYVLRREAGVFAEEELARWFDALHPDVAGVGVGAWTAAAFRGRTLLRKTAWYVRPPCTCTYDYADTHQEAVSSLSFRQIVEEVSQRVSEVCGVAANPPNSVNLNYYPPGGGVGFHADDETLFDGLRREVAIISLSLAGRGGQDGLGSRWFEVKLKKHWGKQAVRAVELRHGDLMTMEGCFQRNYLHSAWPGDRMDLIEGPGRTAYGERINLTWRWVVQHTSSCLLAARPPSGPNGKGDEES